jgi:hypothetical protein
MPCDSVLHERVDWSGSSDNFAYSKFGLLDMHLRLHRDRPRGVSRANRKSTVGIRRLHSNSECFRTDSDRCVWMMSVMAMFRQSTPESRVASGFAWLRAIETPHFFDDLWWTFASRQNQAIFVPTVPVAEKMWQASRMEMTNPRRRPSVPNVL